MRTITIGLLLLCGWASAQEMEPVAVYGFVGHTLFPDEAAAMGLYSGVIVNQLSDRSTASEAGLLRDDVVIEAAGTTVIAWEQLGQLIIATGIGNQLEVVVLRNGERVELSWRVQDNFEYSDGIGSPMLPLRVDSWTKEAVTVESLQGKVTVVMFWWKALDSAAEVVSMCKEWHDSLADKGLVVVPIHVVFRDFAIHTPEAVATYLAELDLPMSVGASSGGHLARPGEEMSPPLVITDWQLSSVPTIILLDKQGLIRGNFIFAGQEGFKEGVGGAIEELVAE